MEIEIENPALKKVVANEVQSFQDHYAHFQSFLREVIYPEVVDPEVQLRVRLDGDSVVVESV